jgi:hypothetical protein
VTQGKRKYTSELQLEGIPEAIDSICSLSNKKIKPENNNAGFTLFEILTNLAGNSTDCLKIKCWRCIGMVG